MKITDIFVGTVEDLRHRSRLSAPEYDVVQASGLVRRLLIDGTALAPQAIKALDLPQPRYEWASVYHGTVASALLDATVFRSVSQARLMESSFFAKAIRSGDLAEFLAYRVVAFHGGGGVTVKDLIKHYANGEGGVHYGALRDPIPPGLAAMLTDPVYAPRLQATVSAIGRIVCTALAEPVMIAAHPELRDALASADLPVQPRAADS